MASWNTKRLMMAEIENESEGGESPATLSTALDSIFQGYKPWDDFSEADAETELRDMIKGHGANAHLEQFLTDEDWDKRSKGVM